MESAAESAGEKKDVKYHELAKTFTPSFQSPARLLVPSRPKLSPFLLRRIALVTGDPREESFLFKRLSITVQRFNSVCFKGALTTPPDTEGQSFQRNFF